MEDVDTPVRQDREPLKVNGRSEGAYVSMLADFGVRVAAKRRLNYH